MVFGDSLADADDGEPFEPDEVPERYVLTDVRNENTEGDYVLTDEDADNPGEAWIAVDEDHIYEIGGTPTR